MSEPYQECLTCGRRRNCLLHRRAEFPPARAKAWLVKTCSNTMAPDCCTIQYRVGIEIGRQYTGQSAESEAQG